MAAAAATGQLNVWCPNGMLTVKGKVVEVTASEGADVKGGTVSLKATGSSHAERAAAAASSRARR